MRLQKVLAAAGVASRRRAEELIRSGRVEVNGRVVTTLGVRVRPGEDRVAVDGQLLPSRQERVVYALNKPRGVLTTMRDPRGRPCVADLVKHLPHRVFPVGRLDRRSEGLLLLTTDGEYAHRVAHPRHGVVKTYLVTLGGQVGEEVLRAMARGVVLAEGRTAPAEVALVRQREDRAVVAVALREGKNREIRRMAEALGYPVLRLVRVAVGSLVLSRLPPGAVRRLSPGEAQRALVRPAGGVVGVLRALGLRAAQVALPEQGGRTPGNERGEGQRHESP